MSCNPRPWHRLMTAEELIAVGCRRWDEDLVLFPVEWFDEIPTGFPVVTINGDHELFHDGMSRDRRWGLLAFGITVMLPSDPGA